MNSVRWSDANIAAALLLLLASFFTFYRWHYQPRSQAAAGLSAIADGLRSEAVQKPRVPAAARGEDGATIPELLSRVQQMASDNNVALKSVTANPANAEEVSFAVEGDFRDILRFLGRVETLHATIDGFEFAPSPDGAGVSASVELLHGAGPGAPSAFADYIDAIALYSAVRNPFAMGDPVPLPNAGSDLGDLSWTYHLTSISLVGAERIATIDGKDYKAGDAFNGMTISAIGPSSVSLNAKGKPLIQQLHFRHNAAEPVHAGQ